MSYQLGRELGIGPARLTPARRPILTTAIRACRYFSLRCSSRADSSGDFFEVAEAEGLDHLGLHGRDVFVGLVGAERRANDGADSAGALGLTDELDDGLRDIVRIRSVLALERRCQGRDHGVGDVTDLAIGLGDFDACGRLNVGEKVGRVSALTSSSTVLTPSLRRASAASRFLPCNQS